MAIENTGEICQLGAALDATHPSRVLYTPYLPPEIQRIITQYVNSVDLPNYRLASKTLAEFGAEELFSTVTFHCSSASIARINAIKSCSHLNKCVNTLLWDTNFWSIPDVRDLHEWTRYFHRKAEYHGESMIMIGREKLADRLTDIANNRQEWERYLDSVQDEKSAKQLVGLQNALAGFQNLYKMHILNGELTRAHRGIKRLSEVICPPQGSAAFYRGESLYNDGGPVYDIHQEEAPISLSHRPGGFAFTLFYSYADTAWPTTKLRLNAVSWKVIAFESLRSDSLQHVTSLHLKLTMRREYHWGGPRGPDEDELIEASIHDARRAFRQHKFMSFLANLPQLESLKLDLGGHNYDGYGEYAAPSTTDDIFSEHHTWLNLRKITLHGFDTRPEALLSLLHRQRSTLKVLKLHNIWIDPDADLIQSQEMDWFPIKPPELLTKMRDIVQLERASLSGYFGLSFAIGGDLWDFGDECLAQAAEKFLIEGGNCPLNECNRSKRKR
jgi:hypothetical protein